MPKIKVNGKEIEVKEGTLLIEAFKQAQEDIAHYCWHPGLSTAGVCRLCMVEIEGNPRLQIACNTVVTEGMSAHNNSDKIKETVKWGLDFHLINHPLDCPVCDQAGECGLQDQYMKFGKYTPEMSEHKVKKRKVVSLGERVVLDSERCILCSRCVRFTSEVSKTNELGIFNRGDRAEIGTFDGKPLNNNYSLNTVDICPVGALTSKDFRFRQRVWYLKNAQSVCTGCSTGCNIRVYYNEEGLFRIKPEYNPEVNGYWMCDKGRDIYKQVNRDARLIEAKFGQAGNWEVREVVQSLQEAGDAIRQAVKDIGPTR
ncbi:MAG: (2Fe-2S)-binding protein, partial [Bdellovibrionales bacterium]|nr:(2Fe-2S)-binding protein [Bdellovibrionales bacterium]